MKLKNIYLIIIISLISFITLSSSYSYKKEPYGVFISINDKEISKLYNYETVVIDSQYFSKKSISQLKKRGIKIYSYINIGSLENFRNYYKKFDNIILSNYENWNEEFWIDVSDIKWQNFIINNLSKSMINKGIDGFFVDNTDIYYHYKNEEIFSGLEHILKSLRSYKKDVIINGGDDFVNEYYSRSKNINDILTGINQETVFSSINFENKQFSSQVKQTKKYYEDYIKKYKNLGIQIYLIEYTKDLKLIKEIQSYCKENDYKYYISDSIELD